MNSKHSDKFNHDKHADIYDNDVTDSENPIRAAYNDVLRWVVSSASIGEGSTVLDLGSGTGNTSAHIKKAAKVNCVDISGKMTDIAREKLSYLPSVEFVQSDILEFLCRNEEKFDAIISTYALHHLTEEEKHVFIEKAYNALKAGGRLVIGDLMFESKKTKLEIYQKYSRQDDKNVTTAVDEEFFWDIENTLPIMENLGLNGVVLKQFSELSWAFKAHR